MLNGLTSFQLKLIAIVAMTVDHVGLYFDIPIFRIIGRITFPLFAFLISEGAYYTKNIYKYFARLLLFAISIDVILQILYLKLNIEAINLKNVFFTLSFGLSCIIIYSYPQLNKFLKITSVSLILFTSNILNFDYGAYGVLMILMFYTFRNNKLQITAGLILLNIYYMLIFDSQIQWFSLASLPIIFLYNNSRGKDIKYFFYLYYPAHLAVIHLIYQYIR